MSDQDETAQAVLSRPLDLPCGARLKNRLIKSAMSDSLGDGTGNPTEPQMRLYERWAEGGTALSLIGEVQISPDCPEKPGNLVLVPDANLDAMRALARRGSADGARIWPQLGHAGALAHAPISQPKGPSPLEVGGLSCAGMTAEDLRALPGLYARTAKLAQSAGFGGVQIHAGHGFLLSQFLSPLFNHRTDAYGGSIDRRMRIVCEIVEAVRLAVGPAFPIGIKINATDKLVGGLTEDEALEGVRRLDSTSIDLIDVSGGTYFPGAASSSDGAASDGPYFQAFARRAKAITSVPIMLTGGVRTREDARAALAGGAADAVGLARAMVLDPGLANRWLSVQGGDPAFPVFEAPPQGGITAWYTMRLTALGEEAEAQFATSPQAALDAYDRRDAERSARWLKHFG
ncbi:MAG: oxidoreductase [Pseudomonadota bacterium]